MRKNPELDNYTRKARRPAQSCSTLKRVRTTRREPALFTVRQIPIRCSWKSWGCTCRVPASSIRTRALRDALTVEATHRVAAITALSEEYLPIGRIIDERAIVNGVVGLLATGGSTNHLLHLIAIAQAAGIALHLEDFGDLAHAVPLLARIYPNGKADVNHFDAAGGMGFLIAQLLDAGMLHADVATVAGQGLRVPIACARNSAQITRSSVCPRRCAAAICRSCAQPRNHSALRVA